MNLKTNKINIFKNVLILLLISFNIWNVMELNRSQRRIYEIDRQLSVSEYNWMNNYSLIYSHYFSNKDFIHAAIGHKTSVLIYRYSKYMCESCRHEDFHEIELLQKEIGKEKILLVPSSYLDNRSGRIELASDLSKFNYVNIPVDDFIMPSQDGDFLQRYFALIDKEGNLSMLFFPQRNETKLTRIYFSEVKKILAEK